MTPAKMVGLLVVAERAVSELPQYACVLSVAAGEDGISIHIDYSGFCRLFAGTRVQRRNQMLSVPCREGIEYVAVDPKERTRVETIPELEEQCQTNH